ncbi:acetyl-CoA C-acetyltransferase [Brenneria sp. KBI 447]|uniref:Acetyl-CoA C-acetyltransferase n=2 Tax=Brenneria izbisi TaxID=2939450 RepID=A0AA41XXX4_9GAMM|nr:acetyl-CoA C-acetyltransferase [Brenneria izbisi]MCV9878756.1 acetyl-CoA C-acetyltransferase [Brenneria izbisi]MCV9882061.1 acetyl-CoA C-acetyltransferase [Brenneria izbisi]
MKDVVIVSAARTPIGCFGGALKDLSAIQLGEYAVSAAISRAAIKASEVDEVIMGNVLGAGLGQNIARQVAISAGIPFEKSAFSVSKVCGSGLKAVILGAQAIALGDAEVVVAGGTESMSNTMYLASAARWGQRMGDSALVDSLLSDGLTDAFSGEHMGNTAENLAQKYHLTREALDAYAAESQQRAEWAQKNDRFDNEIVPIKIIRRTEERCINADEFPRHGTTAESLSRLRPAFRPEGVVTAGNSSGINDGAAALVLMSREKAQALQLQPLVVIRAWGGGGVDPKIMGYGPVPATRLALEKAGLRVEDLDLIEANEAFAAQSLSVMKGLGLDPQKTNVNGGAIALGHPIGASGARILVSLVYEMQRRHARYGLATLCIGGGMGLAIVVEKEES